MLGEEPSPTALRGHHGPELGTPAQGERYS
jgi:hypothetical protein